MNYDKLVEKLDQMIISVDKLTEAINADREDRRRQKEESLLQKAAEKEAERIQKAAEKEAERIQKAAEKEAERIQKAAERIQKAAENKAALLQKQTKQEQKEAEKKEAERDRNFAKAGVAGGLLAAIGSLIPAFGNQFIHVFLIFVFYGVGTLLILIYLFDRFFYRWYLAIQYMRPQ